MKLESSGIAEELYDDYARKRRRHLAHGALEPKTALGLACQVASNWTGSQVLLMNPNDPKWSSIKHLEADHVIASLLEEIERHAQDIIARLQHRHAAGMPHRSMQHPGKQQAATPSRPNLQLKVQIYSLDKDFFTLDQLDRQHTPHPHSAGVRFQPCNFLGTPTARPDDCISALAYARKLALTGKQACRHQRRKAIRPALQVAAAKTTVICYDWDGLDMPNGDIATKVVR
jgi:hypothetical protein